MTAEARAQALDVIRARLGEPAGVELLIALQYCGMLRDDALAPLRADDAETGADLIGRILSVPPAPEPAYAQPAARMPERRRAVSVQDVEEIGRVIWAGRARHRVGGHRGTLFARWMEGEIPWSPAVMGWDDDDPRADGYRDG